MGNPDSSIGNPDSSIGKPDRGKWQQRPEQGKTTVGNPDGEILQGLDQTEDISKWGTRTCRGRHSEDKV